MRIGVLALQGDFREHLQVLRKLNVPALEVRTPAELEGVDGLIIPGGESTTISILLEKSGIEPVLRARAAQGLPVYGTCAGLIVLAKEIIDGDEKKRLTKPLGLLDVTVRRNAYGRQVASFEEEIEIAEIGRFNAVFIRAPIVERVGPGVRVLAYQDGHPVMVQEGNTLATSFHPELTDDPRVHQYFLGIVQQHQQRKEGKQDKQSKEEALRGVR